MNNTSGKHESPESMAARLLESLRIAICVVAEPILVVDSRMPRILEANPSACALVGCSLVEIRRANAPQLLQRIGLSKLLPTGANSLTGVGAASESLWHDAATGGLIRWRILPPTPSDDGILTVVGCPVDVLSHDSSGCPQASPPFPLRMDPLTGLPDRTAFEERLAAKCAQTQGVDEPSFAVLFIDLDGFKGVNDRFGHRYGDRVLRDIAQRLRQALRPGDLVARFGGDEFTVLLNAVHSAQDATRIAERLLSVAAAVAQESPNAELVSISVGIALGRAGMSPPLLIDAADRAMYRAKSAGGAAWAVGE